MPKPSKIEIEKLERLERDRWQDYHFLRQTPREQADIPFAHYAPKFSWKSLVLAVATIAIVILISGELK
jgi:hypothetical protein